MVIYICTYKIKLHTLFQINKCKWFKLNFKNKFLITCEVKSKEKNPDTILETLIRLRRRESINSSEEENLNTEIGWTKVNEQVDIVIPQVLEHLHKLGIEFLKLPEMKETISVSTLFIRYETGIFLTNGIVYNVAGITRYEDAYMTYKEKSFVCKFYLTLSSLQFEYNFLLKLMALEGFGKVIGSLDDTIIYAEIAINVIDTKIKVHDFRIIKFRNIQVQLDQTRIIRHITGLVLSPITNLFKDRITTSISDGLKDQIQEVLDDFNNEDPLQLSKFSKKMLSGLTGQNKITSQE